METAARRLWIEGRVQGVGYRAWASGEARSLGLAGWVRNRHDGRVEMVVCGAQAAVEEMIARCRSGPPGAVVIKIGIEPFEVAGIKRFATLPTD